MALEAQNNPFTSVLMVEAADVEALPDTDPSAGSQRLAVGTDHLLYLVNSSGTKTAVGGGGIANPLATDSLWDAAGDLVQGSGANTAAKLSAGTAGKVLTSNGAAAALTWETPSGSGATAGENFLASDQTLTASTWVDLVSTSLAAGTYCFWGAAILANGAATYMTLRLYDGTNVLHTMEIRETAANLELPLNVHATNVVFGSTTSIKLQANTGNVTGTCIAFGNSTGQNLTTQKITKLSWLKIA